MGLIKTAYNVTKTLAWTGFVGYVAFNLGYIHSKDLEYNVVRENGVPYLSQQSTGDKQIIHQGGHVGDIHHMLKGLRLFEPREVIKGLEEVVTKGFKKNVQAKK